jgi:hypothetical protein
MSNRKETYLPDRSQIIQLIKDGETPLMRDSEGRIYGPIQDSTITDALISAGIVDKRSKYLYWMFRPTKGKGPYAKELHGDKDRSAPNYLLSGEELGIPSLFESIQMYDYRRETEIGVFQVLAYLARKPANKKVSSIVLEKKE